MPAEEIMMNNRFNRCLQMIFYNSSHYALGIEAASFASVVYGASKDIAESPTAIAGTPK